MVIKTLERYYSWCAQLCDLLNTMNINQGNLSQELEQHQTLLLEVERKLEISEAVIAELRKGNGGTNGEERLQISEFDGMRES